MSEWIQHDVPGCPVPPSTRVIVRFRDETRACAEWLGSICADEIGWNASYRPIEYRLYTLTPQPKGRPMTDMTGKEALEEIVAGLNGVEKVAPGPWDVDSERQDDASPKHHEYALVDGRGYRMLGTENCDYRFGEIHSDGPDEDGFFFDWNEPSRVLTWFLRCCSPDRIRTIAADFAALEATRDKALVALAEMTQVYREAEARAVAAEERVKRLEAALTPYVKATKYNGAGAFALNTAMLSDTDHRTAHRIIVTEPALECAALAGDKPKAERTTVNDSMTILRRLADGDTIVYSQDGDQGWFTRGDRAFVGDKITTLRACGFIKCEIDPTDETDNYRGLAEYDTISDLGRLYLKERSHDQ